MFLKLVRHEFKATAPAFLKMILALLGITFIAMLMISINGGNYGYGERYGMVSAATMFSTVLSILTLIIVSIAGFIFIIWRFYSTMVGKGAYLTYSLPVGPAALVGSKLLVAVIWKLVIGFLVFVCGIMLAFTALMNISDRAIAIDNIREGMDYLSMFQPDLYEEIKNIIAIAPIFAVIESIYSIVGWYFALAVGMQFPKYKIGVAILTVIITSFIIQFISGFIFMGDSMNLFSTMESSYYLNENILNNLLDFQRLIMIKSGVLSIVISVIYTVATCFIVKRRPNVA